MIDPIMEVAFEEIIVRHREWKMSTDNKPMAIDRFRILKTHNHILSGDEISHFLIARGIKIEDAQQYGKWAEKVMNEYKYRIKRRIIDPEKLYDTWSSISKQKKEGIKN